MGIFKLLRRERDPAATGHEATIERPVFSVEKVYKGDLKPGETYVFREGNCHMSFVPYPAGTRFLFYIDRSSFFDDKYWGIFCGNRSGTVGESATDLAYLDDIDRLRGKTRLSGYVFRRFLDAVEGDRSGAGELTGWPVVISGNGKTFRLKTDKDGFYEIYDLAPGSYRVTSRKIKGYDPYDGPEDLSYIEVKIEPGRHTERNIAYLIDNAVSGRLLDANGLSLEKVLISLIPAAGKVGKGFSEFTWTKPGGYFELRSIPAGSYLVFVSDKLDVTTRMPDEGFYYGGTTDRKKASVITIRPGQVIKDLIIKAPK